MIRALTWLSRFHRWAIGSPQRVAGRCAAGLTLLTAGASTRAAEVSPAGRIEPACPPAQVHRLNTFTASEQAHAVIAARPDGGYVVAWDSRRQQAGTYGVYGRWVDADGCPTSDEIQLNTTVRNRQWYPAVAVGPDGTAWIVWESFHQDGDAGGIVLRRFGEDASPLGDEMLVNTEVRGHQHDAVVAVDAAGRATIAWAAPSGPAGCSRVQARCFDADGTPLGPEFSVAPAAPAIAQRTPTLVATDANQVAVIWAETDRHARPARIRARVLAGDLPTVEPTWNLTAPTGGQQPVEPAAARLADGRLVVIWHEAADGDYRVTGCAVNLADKQLAALPVFSPPTAAYVGGAAVAALPGGGLITAWNQLPERAAARTPTVRMARIDRLDAEPATPRPLLLPASGAARLTAGRGNTRLLVSARGDLAVAWSGDSGQGDGSAANLTVQSVFPDPMLPAPAPGPVDTPPAQSHPSVTAASPLQPPTYDPTTIPTDPYGGDPRAALRTDGGFIGIVNTGWNPPDPHLAAGPDHLVHVTNGRIAFFTHDGALTFAQPVEGVSGFWGAVGALEFVFDPEVIFDPHSHRFMVVANERTEANRSLLLLAVSDDDDPNGTWYKYRFDVTDITDRDIDSPNISVDTEAVYLTADFFAPIRHLVFILDKSPVLSGLAPTTRHLLLAGSHSYGLPIAQDAAAPAQYMIQAFETASASTVRLHAIVDPLVDPQIIQHDVSVPTYGPPFDPPQLGTTNRPELFEARFWSCIYRNGSLWAVHHQGGLPCRVRWYEFAMNGWPASGQLPTLAQHGELDYGPDEWTYFPSIGVNALGTAVITFAQSAPTSFINIVRTFRLATDPPNTMRPPELVLDSLGPFTLGRWGDYSATVDDPDEPGRFWLTHEYTPGNDSWNTYIAPLDTCLVSVAGGVDCNSNGVHDACDPDCNANAFPDDCDIIAGSSADCDGSGLPDECELAGNDCNNNGLLDVCEIAGLIADEPDDALVCAGGTVSFTVIVPGGDSYQWYRDGAPVAGATAATLQLTDIDGDDAGTYTCAVGVGCLATTSTPAELTVVDDMPTISSQPVAQQERCRGDDQYFSIQAEGGPQLSYQWLRNGLPLVDDGRVTGSQSPFLIVADLDFGDAGVYVCAVINVCGVTNSAPSTLQIADPMITVPPADSCAEPAATVVFSVDAASTVGPVGYKWRKDGAGLLDGGPYSGTTTDTLTISNVTAAEAGAYSVLTFSLAPFCNNESEPATLTVGGCGACPLAGDFDGDGDVDLVDWQVFALCIGADVVLRPECACGNAVDVDTKITVADWALLADTLTGPSSAP